MNKELIKEWNKLSDEEKSKWNGFKGFVEGRTFKEDSLFKDGTKLTKQRK